MHNKEELNTDSGFMEAKKDIPVMKHKIPMKLSPKKGTRSWYEEGTELVRRWYEGSGVP